jgi:hypothetical protein
MSPERPDIGKATPERVTKIESDWQQIDRLALPDHPRYKEYVQKRTQAQLIALRIRVNMRNPLKFEEIENDMQEIADKYNDACQIRLEFANEIARREAGATDGKTIEDSIEPQTDSLKDFKDARGHGKALSTIAKKIDQNKFYDRFKGPNGELWLQPNFEAAERALKDLSPKKEEDRLILDTRPDIVQTRQQLKNALSTMREVDPIRANFHDSNKRIEAGKGASNYTPLRLAGALVGAICVGIGIRNKSFGWPFWLWSAVLVGSVNPNLFTQSASSQSLEKMRNVYTPEARRLIINGFQGPKANEAFTELQTIAKDGKRRKMMNDLLKQDRIENAQIGALTDPSGALGEVLLRYSGNPGQQKAILRSFGRRMDAGDTELMEAVLNGFEKTAPPSA